MTKLSTDDLKVGQRYRIHHKSPRQTWTRESVMAFIRVEVNLSDEQVIFWQAETPHGVQTILASEIIAMWETNAPLQFNRPLLAEKRVY